MSPTVPPPPSCPACSDEGVGLAAPQVGVNIRLMVFNEMGKRGVTSPALGLGVRLL